MLCDADFDIDRFTIFFLVFCCRKEPVLVDVAGFPALKGGCYSSSDCDGFLPLLLMGICSMKLMALRRRPGIAAPA